MRITLVGHGRLGSSLAVLLARAGFDVAVCGRGELVPAADVVVLAVPDRAITTVSRGLPTEWCVLHTSGAIGVHALVQVNRGVLHPLMTFPGVGLGLPDLRGAGALVDGTPLALGYASELATAIGLTPFELGADESGGDRTRYHAAACLASGHLAALFLDAVKVLVRAGVSPVDAPRLLLPLSLESLRRAAEFGPAALTGPAARGDTETMDAHRHVLEGPDRRIYDLLAERIRDYKTEVDGG